MLYLKNAQPVKDIDVLDRAFHYGDGCFTTAASVETGSS
jgi:Branched-chain amino acid aminotransferase/4-amino-4-deoxychorismate lyase